MDGKRVSFGLPDEQGIRARHPNHSIPLQLVMAHTGERSPERVRPLAKELFRDGIRLQERTRAQKISNHRMLVGRRCNCQGKGG